MQRSSFRQVLALLACFLVTVVGVRSAEALSLSHSGSADPTSQGWTQNGQESAEIAIGAVTGDVGGRDAWRVDDRSVTEGLDYRFSVDGAVDLEAVTFGWEYSTSLRVTNPDDTPDNAVTMLFRSSILGRSFRLIFGSDSDGDPIVEAVTMVSATDPSGIAYTLEGVGSVYNTYRVLFDPVSQTADVFVNGVERISDWAGAVEPGGSLVVFGSGSAPTTGEANYHSANFVSFVPEPSWGILLGAGLGTLGIRRSIAGDFRKHERSGASAS